MPDPIFIDTLRSWQNFYFMLGGASAALAGLMFVALSLGQHLITENNRDTFEIFTEPNIYYYITVLLLSAVMLVPSFTPVVFTWTVLIGGVIALVRTGYHSYLLFRIARRHGDFNLGDWIAQLTLPLLSYALIPAAGVLFLMQQRTPGFFVLAVATVLVLISGIINTWGMVIWIIYQTRSPD